MCIRADRLILGLTCTMERSMARTPPEPYGDYEDYEYDLLHEPGVQFQLPREQHHDSEPSPQPDPGGDYGYDEAHDCRAGGA